MSRTFTGAAGSYLKNAGSVWQPGSGNITIAAWIYPTAVPSTSEVSWQVVVESQYAATIVAAPSYIGGASQGGLIVVTTGTGLALAAFSGQDFHDFWSLAISANSSIPLNVWSHVACTINGTTGAIVLYLNGVVLTPVLTSNVYVSSPGFETLFVGGQDDGTAQFTGSIDSVAIWTTVLTQAQIVTAMGFNGPANLPTNLVEYWPLLGTISPEPDTNADAFSFTVFGSAQGTNSPGQTGPPFQTGLFDFLTTQPAITALIGTPSTRGDGATGIWPILAPNESTMPYLTFHRVHGAPVMSMEGANRLQNSVFRFSCYGSSYPSAVNLALQLKLLFATFLGTWSNGTVIQHVQQTSEVDDSESVPHGTIYSVHLDFEFMHVDLN